MSISMSSKFLSDHCGQSFLPIMSQNKRWEKSFWHQVLSALWPVAQHPANWLNQNFGKWWPNTSSFVALYRSSCQIQALMSYSTYWSYLYSVALLNLCLVGECALAPGRPDPLKGVYALEGLFLLLFFSQINMFEEWMLCVHFVMAASLPEAFTTLFCEMGG